MAEYVIEGLDITLQPGNKLFYSHILDPDRIPEENQNEITNDFHVRNELLALYKYDTDQGKLVTFILITILTYCLFFPTIVIHFYRTYNNESRPDSTGSYDNPDLISHRTYTAFVWISYMSLLLKSALCLLQNKFYRHQLYQSANIRGFKGYFDYETQKNQLKHDFGSAIGTIETFGKKKGNYDNSSYQYND